MQATFITFVDIQSFFSISAFWSQKSDGREKDKQ